MKFFATFFFLFTLHQSGSSFMIFYTNAQIKQQMVMTDTSGDFMVRFLSPSLSNLGTSI